MQISKKKNYYIESLQVNDKTTINSPTLSVAEGLPFTFLKQLGP